MSVSTQWTVDNICFQVARLDAISQQEVFERIEQLKEKSQEKSKTGGRRKFLCQKLPTIARMPFASPTFGALAAKFGTVKASTNTFGKRGMRGTDRSACRQKRVF